MQQDHNVIIIGGGPAGLSAAIYAARAGLAPLVFAGSPPGGQLMLTSEVENFPGYTEILGPDLVERLRKQAERFETIIHNDNITSVDFSKAPFVLNSAKDQYTAHAVIIATGAQALWLGLPSEQRLRGKGVSACATCDGFFFKNKIVAVVGGGDTALEEAQTLARFAQKVYIIHRRDRFRASKIMQDRVLQDPKIEVIWNAAVTEVFGENRVQGVRLETRNLSVDGLFIAIGHKPDTAVFASHILLDTKGYIVTSAMKALTEARSSKLETRSKDADSNFDYAYQTMTSVPGVFAGGDCVDYLYRQAGTAAGMGIAAALDAERWLTQQ